MIPLNGTQDAPVVCETSFWGVIGSMTRRAWLASPSQAKGCLVECISTYSTSAGGERESARPGPPCGRAMGAWEGSGGRAKERAVCPIRSE